MRMRHVFISGLAGSTIFFHIISLKARFPGKKKLLNTKCTFWFSLQLLSETFLIIRRTERDIINVNMPVFITLTLFLSDLNETWPFATDFRKILKYKISSKSVQWEPSRLMRADGRTGRHDEASSPFSRFYERTQWSASSSWRQTSDSLIPSSMETDCPRCDRAIV